MKIYKILISKMIFTFSKIEIQKFAFSDNDDFSIFGERHIVMKQKV